MNRHKLLLAERLRRLGWPARIGIALLASAAAFHFSVHQPMQLRLARLEQEAVAARKTAATVARDQAGREVRSIDARVDAFYQYFPAKKATPDLLNTIYRAAAQQTIQLTQGEYRIQPSKVDKLLGYQVSLPVRGSYAQIRKFIVQVLREVPAASLDELSFKREAIDSTEVEAKVRLTLYLRAE
ncbi:type 4a pilus biogenesis protein PilO [Noviherbaspirillum massiliense]|uniref:type 4a pilus biogenesis protein PilO n=1 Tax=Noviherbaspirillum massiliense TaxID=1465823 RepID=UPI0003143630|nr:type 4a pilus biogenesis protein PilO [Noviherbaspirillum massiliense]